jgi:CRISPR system Cascade subunit CasB
MSISTNQSASKIEREIKFLQLLQRDLEITLKGEEIINNTLKSKKGNTEGQAAFKKARSGEPEHVRKVYRFLPREISISSEWEEKYIWIPVACLFVFYPQKIEEVKDPKRYNFARSCWDLAVEINKTGESKGTERRFRALLDTSLADICSPLTNLVRQMKSKGVDINYPQLLADLRQWDHPNQYIQDRWARTFWRAPIIGDPINPITEPANSDN